MKIDKLINLLTTAEGLRFNPTQLNSVTEILYTIMLSHSRCLHLKVYQHHDENRLQCFGKADLKEEYEPIGDFTISQEDMNKIDEWMGKAWQSNRNIKLARLNENLKMAGLG